MDKKIQDLAWSILPKEFKEEVKYEYNRVATKATKDSYDLGFMHAHEGMYGLHNLTSDAEGEEMLTVVRSKVQEKWQRAYEQEEKYSRAQDSPVAREELYYNRGIMSILDTLFGSKCLPDRPNLSEILTGSEPKPAKPKLDRGQKCTIIGGKGTKGLIGQIVTLTSFVPEENAWAAMLPDMSFIYLTESDLEPYTEPTETCADDCSCQDHFVVNNEMVDRILKDSFSKERRLNIAAMAMQGLLANTALYEHKVKEWLRCESNDNPIQFIPMLALKYADALIKKSEKGDPDGK